MTEEQLKEMERKERAEEAQASIIWLGANA